MARCARQDGLRIVAGRAGAGAAAGGDVARKSRRARAHRSLADERERWRVEARLTEFLHRLGVDAQRSPHTASGGERKRAALALALRCSPICCCSTSRPTISTSTASRRWRIAARRARRRSSSRTIARFSIASSRASSSSIAACCAAIPATSPPTRSARASSSRPKRSRIASSTSSGRRRRCGSARHRSAPHAQRRSSAPARSIARRTRRAARANWAISSSRSMPASAPASWSPSSTSVGKSFGERPIVKDLSTAPAARRSARPDRPEWRRQVDAAPSDPRAARAGRGHACGSAPTCRSRTSTRCASSSTRRRRVVETISPGSDWVEIGRERKHVVTLPRRLPVRSAAREVAGEGAVGRRAQPAAAGTAVRAHRRTCW